MRDPQRVSAVNTCDAKCSNMKVKVQKLLLCIMMTIYPITLKRKTSY